LIGLAIPVVAGVVAWRILPGAKSPVVVVYVSHDQVFSEPILKDFENDTGIQIRAVYDTEETKSAGAMNRLIAEKSNPQADVYWANEPIRAEVLRQQHIAAPYVSPNAKEIQRNSAIRTAIGPDLPPEHASSSYVRMPIRGQARCSLTPTRSGAAKR
jgi:iron(III) transport system substrate-binding protein